MKDTDESAFLQRLLATFKIEADEHLRALSAGLIELEQAPSPERQAELVEIVFREAHSLKGAARAVGKREIEVLCQGGEDVFSALKRGRIKHSPALLDLLHSMVDTLGLILADLEKDLSADLRNTVGSLTRRLGEASKGLLKPPPQARAKEGPAAKPVEKPPPVPAEKVKEAIQEEAAGDKPETGAPKPRLPPVPAAAEAPRSVPPPQPERVVAATTAVTETVRISVARLDAVLFQAEALVGAKLAAHQRANDLAGLAQDLAGLKKARAKIAVEIRRMEGALEGAMRRSGGEADPRLLEYLAWEESVLKSFETRLARVAKAAETGWRSFAGTVDGLLDDVKKALMLPIASAVEVLPKVVRDISRDQGKEVEVVITGSEIEIDRRILEEIRDPLIHLVRNSVDHGIEKPEARLAAGKPRRATLRVSACQIEGGRMEIRVADDGAGIDRGRLRAAARKLGYPVAQGDGGGLLSLVFLSGVSTSPIITDMSGRGLGLAIVREKVERLGGMVEVKSEPGQGTVFRVVLPLTLATFRGVLVRAGEQFFVFPTMQLERVLRVRPEDVGTVENQETLLVEGRAVALTSLTEVLGIEEAAPGPGRQAGSMPVVVAGTGERRVAFRVDQVLGEQEVLMKGLGRQLARVRNIAGASVLGTGQVVPVLHVPDILESARHVVAAPARSLPAVQEDGEGGQRSILVAEDSITSRMLLKGILESAGYEVTTAVDGMDAYSRLSTGDFDLLVSDVDMPRMSGFDLTAKVRSDRRLAELPVVLVTSLDSRQDRERGAEVGANAYIVKSQFDQSNLLAVVRRLL